MLSSSLQKDRNDEGLPATSATNNSMSKATFKHDSNSFDNYGGRFVTRAGKSQRAISTLGYQKVQPVNYRTNQGQARNSSIIGLGQPLTGGLPNHLLA